MSTNRTVIPISIVAAAAAVATTYIWCSLNRYYMVSERYMVDKRTGTVWFMNGTVMLPVTREKAKQ